MHPGDEDDEFCLVDRFGSSFKKKTTKITRKFEKVLVRLDEANSY